MPVPQTTRLSGASIADAGLSRENLLGIAAMLAAMAGFVANDACAKLVSEDLPLGEILVLRNAYIGTVVLLIAAATGALSKIGTLLSKPVGWRAVGEVVSTPLYLLALFHMPIANVTAILQMLPLVLTVAAAVMFRESVGPRRWIAALVGLLGVLLIVQPGTDAFSPWSLSAAAALGFIAMRDIATRRIPSTTPTLLIAGSTSVVVFTLGLVLMPFETWAVPTPRHLALLVASGTFLLIAYLCITVAMRTGELSLVGLFRYSIVIWAVLLGYLVWGEWPDPLALMGSVLVVATGAYTVYRERTVRRPAQGA